MYAKDTTNNTTREVTCTTDGAVRVAVVSGDSGGGGGGGTSDTTEATQLLVKTAVQSLDTNLGTKADTAATTDTGSFSILAFLKRSLQNWTSLLNKLPSLSSNNRVPVEIKTPILSGETISLASLAAGSSAFTSIVDLGAAGTRSTVLITLLKSNGVNQADAIYIQQSDDATFATWTYAPRGDKSSGAVFSWTNASGSYTSITACPSLRYVRGGFSCLSGGTAQPSTSQLIIGVFPGGI